MALARKTLEDALRDLTSLSEIGIHDVANHARALEMLEARQAAARVMKTIGFPVDEWTVIDELMHRLQVREFTSLCKIALADLADKNDMTYPGTERKAS